MVETEASTGPSQPQFTAGNEKRVETEQELQFRQKLQPYCNEKDVTRLPDGTWIIRPKPDLSHPMFARMFQWLQGQLGGKYSSTAGTFELKAVFGTQQIGGNEQSASIPTDKLIEFPYGPRKRLNEDRVQRLAKDMKTNGQTQRITVRPSKNLIGYYEVLDGRHRSAASRLIGWVSLDAIIKNCTDKEARILAFTFFDREDMTGFEYGCYFHELMRDYAEDYPTLQSVADAFGYKSRSTISEYISLYLSESHIMQKQQQPTSESDDEDQQEQENTSQTPSSETEQPTSPETESNMFERPNMEEKPQETETEPAPITSPTMSRLIRNADPELQPELRRMATQEGASIKKVQEKIQEEENKAKIEQQLKQQSETALQTEQQSYAKDEKTEAAKQRSLINSLTDTYPEPILQAIVTVFNRVDYGGMNKEKLAVKAQKLCSILFDSAEAEGTLDNCLRRLEEEA